MYLVGLEVFGEGSGYWQNKGNVKILKVAPRGFSPFGLKALDYVRVW